MRNNILLLQKELKAVADCAIITSDINRLYLTGMKSSAGTVLVFEGKAYLIIDFRYIEKARACVENCEVVLENNLTEQINSLILKHSAKTVCTEVDRITYSRFVSLREKLTAELLDTNWLSEKLSQLRSVKAPQEVEKIKAAQCIAEQSFRQVLDFIRPGVTEREIALFLDCEMQRRGSLGVSFETIVLSGKNTSMPHGVPSDKRVQSGDFVLMDFGAVYDGYHSDMTRTVAVGKPDDKMISVYNTVLNAQQAAIDAVKAGIYGNALDKTARDVIERAGYADAFGHSLGHGVGLEIHEAPNASPRYNKPIVEGSVITIEPGIYLPDEFGVRIEDMVFVTKDGCENLTSADKSLIIL